MKWAYTPPPIPAKRLPTTNASSLLLATSIPMTLAAVSSSRTDMMARPVLDWSRFRITTITPRRKTKAQNQVVSFGMPIMPRPPFISGKGRMVSEFTIRVLMTMVKPRVAMPK